MTSAVFPKPRTLRGAMRHVWQRITWITLIVGVLSAPAEAYVHHPNIGGWGGPGTVITYSFMPTGPSFNELPDYIGTITALSDFMPADWESEIEAALQSWSDVCGVTFQQVADAGLDFNDPAATNGHIRIGGHAFDGAFGVLAHGYYPPPNGSTAAGDVHFDTGESWQTPANPGGTINLRAVAAHEFGHSLGLMHTGVPNSLMNAIYNPAITGPQADDIAGAQAQYGESGSGAPEPAFLAFLVVPALTWHLAGRRDQ